MRSMIRSVVYSVIVLSGLTGCGIYSFSGTTITAKSITINNFFNDASNGPNNLGVVFTDKLRDYFQQNTSLAQVPDDGELQMEGSITGYRITPVAPTATGNLSQRETANLTRLTITVKVNYVNVDNEEFNFNKEFSQFADFDSDQGLTAVENQLIDEIFDQIILDIFNASVANW